MSGWVYIALLRAVNVGADGGRKVVMADLRAMASHIGLENPRTLLQSGNLVCGSALSAADLEAQLERETEARLGVRTDFMVRTPEDIERVIALNPYPEEAQREPSRLLVSFLKHRPAPEVVSAVLEAASEQPERLHVENREAYVFYPQGAGTSKLKLNFRTPGTARNWNTVLKLAALAQG